MTDKRLMDKYEKMSAIWSENFDPMNTDWNSLLDAVQRDITQLFNDYKFKRLVKHIESGYGKDDVILSID